METANGWINRIFIIIISTTYLRTYKSILKMCKSIRNTYQMIRWQASMPWRGTWEFPELDFLRIRVHDDDWAHHKYLQQRFQDTKKIIKKTLVFTYNIVWIISISFRYKIYQNQKIMLEEICNIVGNTKWHTHNFSSITLSFLMSLWLIQNSDGKLLQYGKLVLLRRESALNHVSIVWWQFVPLRVFGVSSFSLVPKLL